MTTAHLCLREGPLHSTLALLALAGLAACDASSPEEPASPTTPLAVASPLAATTPTVCATGLRFPRGFTWEPDGSLYLAEAGSGGTRTTTTGQCDQVVPPVGPYSNGSTARISRIDAHGRRTTFAIGFLSAQNAMGDVLGVADVASRRLGQPGTRGPDGAGAA